MSPSMPGLNPYMKIPEFLHRPVADHMVFLINFSIPGLLNLNVYLLDLVQRSLHLLPFFGIPQVGTTVDWEYVSFQDISNYPS